MKTCSGCLEKNSLEAPIEQDKVSNQPEFF